MTEIQAWAQKMRAHIGESFLGDSDKIDLLLSALLSEGHVLIEDFPGTGKTLLAREIATLAGGDFRQIQCTPDLLPADVLGVSVYNEEKQKFLFRKGPVITNFLLVDEINRATPRTQSALLEAMAEGQVSVEGRSMALPRPFFLIATESPVESEGTFPLPEVQKDRFLMTLTLGYPEKNEEKKIMKGEYRKKPSEKKATSLQEIMNLRNRVSKIYTAPSMKQYILSIIEATRGNPSLVMGVSPRGTLALHRCSQAMAALNGRDYVIPEDVKKLCYPVLTKRLLLKQDRYGRGGSVKDFINQLLEDLTVPPLEEMAP